MAERRENPKSVGEVIDRIPPQDVAAEMAVLGAMLIEREAVSKAFEVLDDTSFYKTDHQRIFQAMQTLFERSDPIDTLTVSAELQKAGNLDAVGGAYYLTELASRVPSAANVTYHARIVLEKSLLRKLINVSTAISSEAYEGAENAGDLLDRAEQQIFSLSERRLRRGFESLSPILNKTFETIEGYHQRQGVVTGVATGFSKLDELTSGLQKSELIIVAGRPSMGKTAFCLNIARNSAVDHGIGVGFFSLEMASYQLAMRLLCAEARVNAHSVRTGKLPKEQWSRLSMSVGKLANAPIYIDDTPAMTVMEIRAKARRLVAEKNVGLFVIDYLQLVRGPKSSESRQIEISMISQSLKALAKELDVPVIALSQLSRAVEQRGGDRRPILSDLRESGAIEQDADVVMFVYRPELYDRSEIEGLSEIIIQKQRNGPTGTVKLVFLKDFVLFKDAAEQHSELTPVEAPF